MASCNWREVLEVEVITPAFPVPPKIAGASEVPFTLNNCATVLSGVLKLAWLSTLKASKRNCSVTLSPKCVLLASDMSRVVTPGPIATLRRELPSRFQQVPPCAEKAVQTTPAGPVGREKDAVFV